MSSSLLIFHFLSFYLHFSLLLVVLFIVYLLVQEGIIWFRVLYLTFHSRHFVCVRVLLLSICRLRDLAILSVWLYENDVIYPLLVTSQFFSITKSSHKNYFDQMPWITHKLCRLPLNVIIVVLLSDSRVPGRGESTNLVLISIKWRWRLKHGPTVSILFQTTTFSSGKRATSKYYTSTWDLCCWIFIFECLPNKEVKVVCVCLH